MSHEVPWWRDGVLYHIYTRSWFDGNDDGVGDLPGILQQLDYLERLGIDGIWLSPVMKSPNDDWGYDVSDYRSIAPEYGDLGDLDALITAAADRGIRTILDIVPGHTSDEHPWFTSSRAQPSSPYRDYYVWRAAAPDGSPPNRWESSFGGPAWAHGGVTGDYYLHRFSPRQPQLNWWNEAVRAEFDEILQFWLARGVAGFRLDALQALLYDPLLGPDGPSVPPEDPALQEVLRRWRSVLDPRRLLLGETWVRSLEQLAAFYGDGTNGVHLGWNVPFLRSRFDAAKLREVVARTLGSLPAGAWAAWAMSTHDAEGRAGSRWCRGDPDAFRCALLLLLTLRGTPILYYGDEIGMVDVPAAARDMYRRDRAAAVSRDPARTPMQWSDGHAAGFTRASAPWLPTGDQAVNVAAQERDPASTLSLVRDLIGLRRSNRALSRGSLSFVPAPHGVLAWMRDTTVLVALNLGSRRQRLDAEGTIAIGTSRARDGQRLRGRLDLDRYEGVVIRL